MKKMLILILCSIFLSSCMVNIRQSIQNQKDGRLKTWQILENKIETDITKFLEIPTRNYVNCQDITIEEVQLSNGLEFLYNQKTMPRHDFDMLPLYLKTGTIQVKWNAYGCNEEYTCHQNYLFEMNLTREFYKLTSTQQNAEEEVTISWSSHKDGISCMVVSKQE